MDKTDTPGLFQRFLDKVEKYGNKLPQPVTIFAIMVVIVLVASWVASMLGLTAAHPRTGEPIEVNNLLSASGIQRILTEMIDVFTGFAPLGLVLAVMLGVGVAERSGMISALLKAFVWSVPDRFLTFSVVVAGIFSSLAADAGYVVLIPLGAVIFHGAGRHPLAGLAAAFAGVSGGFSANLIVTSLDPLLAGFTETAANLLDPDYRVLATANYYFIIAMVPAFGLAGLYVTEKIIEPRLGPYTEKPDIEEGTNDKLTSVEKQGLWWAFGVNMILIFLIFLMVWPENGILRDPTDELSPLSPFYDSLVVLMMILFFMPGLVYGIVTSSITGEKDVAEMLNKTMSDMGAYIVLAFVAAQFVAYFDWSNIGVIVAISGAQGLESLGFTGIPLLIAFVLLSGFINILIGSASAKWAILAPVFVPMFMLMGYSPEMTQAAYRIGDSVTNIISPLLPYFPIIIVFARRYVKGLGIGTIISVMIPYSLVFLLISIIMMVVWIWFELPLGPEAPMYYDVNEVTSMLTSHQCFK